MRLIPALSILSVSVLLATTTGCGKDDAEVEDCTNGTDDDDDGDVDCDDSECATDDACGDTDTDTNTGPDEETDCADGLDDDDDGDVDCDDDDCEGTTDCPVEDCGNGTDDDADGAIDCDDSDCETSEDCRYAWTETGTATVIPGISYIGTTDWLFTSTSTGAELCKYQIDATSTTPRSDCVGCDFAFTVALENGREVSGDCEAVGWADGFSGEYGYGYDADYASTTGTGPALMYYYSGDYSAWYATYYSSASFDGTTFDYSWDLGYDYY